MSCKILLLCIDYWPHFISWSTFFILAYVVPRVVPSTDGLTRLLLTDPYYTTIHKSWASWGGWLHWDGPASWGFLAVVSFLFEFYLTIDVGFIFFFTFDVLVSNTVYFWFRSRIRAYQSDNVVETLLRLYILRFTFPSILLHMHDVLYRYDDVIGTLLLNIRRFVVSTVHLRICKLVASRYSGSGTYNLQNLGYDIFHVFFCIIFLSKIFAFILESTSLVYLSHDTLTLSTFSPHLLHVAFSIFL